MSENSSTDDAVVNPVHALDPEKYPPLPGGVEHTQAMFDEAEEKGYFGTAPDETPPENYTVGGVTSGAPVPDPHRGKR